MRGIKLFESMNLLGKWSGFKLWFTWSFVHPVQHFVWLNITHKEYCTYSGWHCGKLGNGRYSPCTYEHLKTRKAVKEHWAKMDEEMKHVSEGENGKCAYCNKKPGTRLIDDPNGGLGKWKVCSDCDEIIKLQTTAVMGMHIGDDKMVLDSNDKLKEISDRTGIPITSASISKTKEGYNVSSVEFTGEKDETQT